MLQGKLVLPEKSFLMMRILISAAICTVLTASPAAAAQLPPISNVWQGECRGTNEPPLAVTLVITTNALAMTLSGKMNGQDLSALKYDTTRGIVVFDVGGLSPADRQKRHFSGTLKFNESIEGILSSRSKKLNAKCTLKYVDSGRSGAPR